MKDFRVIIGNSLDELKTLASKSVDSCVTDPPYELGFMGKAWDKSGIAYSVELWREVYRVLKPGAYLLAFGGSRTYHRMACAIEDAGFEIRDQIQWIYGSGFPKSLDVSKAIDKMNGDERPVVGVSTAGVGNTAASMHKTEGFASSRESTFNLTSAASAASAAWDGWGTALKPAHEPIVMARKPLEKGLTVAQNVLKWGTGAINVDGCRIEATGESFDRPVNHTGLHEGYQRPWRSDEDALAREREQRDISQAKAASFGRFPANVIHDGSDEVLAEFTKAGLSSSSGRPRIERTGDSVISKTGGFGIQGGRPIGFETRGFDDSGSAARFFYTAKASKYDREAGLPEAGLPEAGSGVGALRDGDRERTLPARNHHPTVKPVDLMQYLCRLVTPPNGLILDPFLGSGSTAKAALIERFRIIGIELNAEYAEIAEARCKQLQVKLI